MCNMEDLSIELSGMLPYEHVFLKGKQVFPVMK